METKLATYLRENDLSHRQFAELAGIPRLHPMVSLWARALARPSGWNARRIEQATEGAVPADYWLSIPSRKNGEPSRGARVTRRRRAASFAHKRLPKRHS